MTQEFVPYELALKLKALGFDEPCLGRWLIITEWEKPTGEVRLQIGSKVEDYSKNQFTAPLYQQAFRWFREKYGLHHDITLSVDNTNQLVGFYIVIHKFDPLWNEDQSIELEVNTTDREEAELACLDKLIEIVESKSE